LKETPVKRRFVFIGIAFFVFAAVASVWADTDPRVGTWKLDVSKSMSSNGQMPASETRTYTAQGNEIMGNTEGVNAKGKPISNHYNATADGKDHPSGGADPSVMLSIKQTGPGAYAGTIKKDGKVIGTNTAVISGGGKVFTFKTKGTDADGKEYTSTMVFEKQQARPAASGTGALYPEPLRGAACVGFAIAAASWMTSGPQNHIGGPSRWLG
jgi:hypothetical protein